MPTFVVSLFHPYTVDFHDLPSPAQMPSPQPYTYKASLTNIPGDRTSLFTTPTPPRTPAAPVDQHIFFAQTQPSAASHFLKSYDPRTLVRSDSHVPEWGTGLFFNQPRSRAGPPIPEAILDYGKAQEIRKAVATQSESARRSLGGRRFKEPSDNKQSRRTEWTIVPAIQGNGGLTNAVKAAQDSNVIGETYWVGTIGFPTDELNEDLKEEIRERLESEYDTLTVFIEDSDFDGHYAHFCKTILWPVFHYQIPDHPKSKAYEDHSWVFYVNVNKAFADKIVQNYKRGDVIWIHDYHLCLVPAMIRKRLPDCQIGFFLHTAFPSSEVFRCLAVRKELLEGILGANLVAFQTKEYAHHFLQTCSRLLIVEATNDGLQLDQRFVNVVAMAIGIDPNALTIARQEEKVLDWIRVMQERYKGKRLIVARDKLDNVRGVRQKLLAFELFLNKYPEWRGKVVMIQVAMSTTEHPELAATISDIVTRIDSQHSTLAHQPLVFLRQDIGFSQYLALLTVADLMMVTSLREGMNLTVHEYIICQDSTACDRKHGPVILSEFTGSASVFGDNALSINPWDYKNTASVINQALEMSQEEKDRRYSKLRDVVLNHTGEFWCVSLMDLLQRVYDEHFSRDTMSIPRLSVSNLSQKYQKSQYRLFVLDYEGTLTPYGSPTSLVLTSPQRVTDTLNDLLMDERNIIYVMSASTPEELERRFSRVPNLGLIAENGCFLREFNNEEWIGFADPGQIRAWKEAVKGMLQYYQERVEHSYVEERHCSLIFHYEKAEDQESATRQAGDCANHINDACESQRVHAVPIDKSVLIEPLDWSKGSAASHIFQHLCQKAGNKEKAGPDFLMVAGNDREDEVIFRWANKLGNMGIVSHVTTVTVGKRNTEAMATLTQGTTGLLSVIQRLAQLN